MKNEIVFYRPDNIQELLYYLKNVGDLTVYGGGTSLYKDNKEMTVNISKSSLFLTKCKECCFKDKKERYMDFGAGFTLSEVLNLGKSNIPEFFYDAVKTVANPIIRNSATIIGNICSKGFYRTLYAPLLAVDAKLEIRNPVETKMVSLSKFKGPRPGEVITKIRLPMIDWDIAIFKRLGPINNVIDISASFTFLALTQKDILTDLRIAFCGRIKIRSTELENKLIGSRLPLSYRAIDDLVESAGELYDKESVSQEPPVHPMLKNQFLNLLRSSLEKLT